MTDNPCNCSNCSTEQCGFNPKCTAITNAVFKSNMKTIHWFTKIWGCTRHPQMREYLMEDMIVELERRINSCQDNLMENAFSYAYYEVITLIRGGTGIQDDAV
jgi:hypothetical protein